MHAQWPFQHHMEHDHLLIPQLPLGYLHPVSYSWLFTNCPRPFMSQWPESPTLLKHCTLKYHQIAHNIKPLWLINKRICYNYSRISPNSACMFPPGHRELTARVHSLAYIDHLYLHDVHIICSTHYIYIYRSYIILLSVLKPTVGHDRVCTQAHWVTKLCM